MSTVKTLEMRTESRPDLGPIFAEHYDLIFSTAYGVTRSAADAEDIAQTIFLQLLQRADSPNLAANPKGYFYKAAAHLALRTIRSRRRHILTDNDERLESSTETTPSSSQKEEMDQRLWNAIAELSGNASDIVILRYVHKLSLSEIARRLGTTRSTVAVSLFRSRARLKKLIRAAQGE